MAPRAVGALLALVAAIAFVVSVASSSWWSGHPSVEGRTVAAKAVRVGLIGATGCNTGGDGTCESIAVGGGFQTACLVELAAIGIATILAFMLAVSASRIGDRRKQLAALLLFVAALATVGAIGVLALGPALHVAEHVAVPIGWGVFVFFGATVAAFAASLVTRKLEPEPLRLKSSSYAPLAMPSNVRDMLREQHDGLRPAQLGPEPMLGPASSASSSNNRVSAPLIGGAPQLRPLYENEGFIPGPVTPPLPSAPPTVRKEVVDQLHGNTTPHPDLLASRPRTPSGAPAPIPRTPSPDASGPVPRTPNPSGPGGRAATELGSLAPQRPTPLPAGARFASSGPAGSHAPGNRTGSPSSAPPMGNSGSPSSAPPMGNAPRAGNASHAGNPSQMGSAWQIGGEAGPRSGSPSSAPPMGNAPRAGKASQPPMGNAGQMGNASLRGNAGQGGSGASGGMPRSGSPSSAPPMGNALRAGNASQPNSAPRAGNAGQGGSGASGGMPRSGSPSSAPPVGNAPRAGNASQPNSAPRAGNAGQGGSGPSGGMPRSGSPSSAPPVGNAPRAGNASQPNNAPRGGSGASGEMPRSGRPSVPMPVRPSPGTGASAPGAAPPRSAAPSVLPPMRASQPGIEGRATMAHTVPPMPTIENTPPPAVLPARDAQAARDHRAATESDDRLDKGMRPTDYMTAVETDADAKALDNEGHTDVRTPALSDVGPAAGDATETNLHILPEAESSVFTPAPARPPSLMTGDEASVARPVTLELAAQTVLSDPSLMRISDAMPVQNMPRTTNEMTVQASLDELPGARSVSGGTLSAELAAQHADGDVGDRTDPSRRIDTDVSPRDERTPMPTHAARSADDTPIPTKEPRAGTLSTAPTNLSPPKPTDVVASGPTPACPQCESPMAWVDEHLRFYCKQCRMYF